MHRGCFVWTPTPPLSGQRTPRPGPPRVCVCVPFLARLSGLASRARSGVPHLFFGRSLCALRLFDPLRAGVALFAVFVGVFFFLFPVAPLLSSALRVFRPGLPWAFASCCPPPFLFCPCLCPLFFVSCAPVVSGVLCSPARGALGLCALLPPPLFFSLPLSFPFFFLSPSCFWRFVFSGPGRFGPVRLVAPPPLLFFSCLCPFLFLCPRCFWRFVFSGPGCLWPLRLVILPYPFLFIPPPPFLFFLFVSWFFFFCRLSVAGRVCVSWAVDCARLCFGSAVPVVALCAVLSRPSGARWCYVVLPVVFWVFAVRPGCPLLSPGGSWCRVPVVLSLSGRVARRPVVWRGVSCCSLPCVVFCCAVLSCGGVLSCSAVCLRRCLCLLFVCCRCASAVCVLGCRAVCSLSSPPCAMLCCAVLVPLRCAVRVICAVSGAWCCWFLVSLPVGGGLLVVLVARRCRLMACVDFGAHVWSGRRKASSLWCPVPLCCVLWRCAAVCCCAVVLCLLFLVLFPCWCRWFSASPWEFPAKPVKMVFCFRK